MCTVAPIISLSLCLSLFCLPLQVKQLIDRETLPPHTVRDLVPLCMQQYQFVFSTTRVPGKEMDALRRWDSAESRHIVVRALRRRGRG